ncbi:LPXTG-site transpeptidase (sortase) family protein [Kytococcus aerolatus]|uniref:LPXTG-site transpeptidase (Sortase) family protein n=1 Tax=Kytococcus aerolatus TaxID=592308 RepID=A0A212U139_9MICO|nr:LPXTG-site transpeptidase (sortase) family protein [Kytococcus aerolatus]
MSNKAMTVGGLGLAGAGVVVLAGSALGWFDGGEPPVEEHSPVVAASPEAGESSEGSSSSSSESSTGSSSSSSTGSSSSSSTSSSSSPDSSSSSPSTAPTSETSAAEASTAEKSASVVPAAPTSKEPTGAPTTSQEAPEPAPTTESSTAAPSPSSKEEAPEPAPSTSSAAPSPSSSKPAPSPSSAQPAPDSGNVAQPGDPVAAPTRLKIPSIGFDREVSEVGLTSKGTLNPPPGITGWYGKTVKPGENGVSVIAGHVTYGPPDVFYHLPNVKVGEKFTMTDANGKEREWKVTVVEEIDKVALSKDSRIWGDSPTPKVALVTCDPDSPRTGGHSSINVFVLAEPA